MSAIHERRMAAMGFQNNQKIALFGAEIAFLHTNLYFSGGSSIPTKADI